MEKSRNRDSLVAGKGALIHEVTNGEIQNSQTEWRKDAWAVGVWAQAMGKEVGERAGNERPCSGCLLSQVKPSSLRNTVGASRNPSSAINTSLNKRSNAEFAIICYPNGTKS
jgi:hypothetical protein